MKNVVVLGASGGLGREIVKAALQKGLSPCAAVRRPASYVPPAGAKVVVADARDFRAVCAALRGQDAVVNAIGAGTLRKNIVESSATRVAVAAAHRAGVRRYIALSAGMVAFRSLPLRFLRAILFRHICREHELVEAQVRGTELNWTIVRPPRLRDGPRRAYRVSTTGLIFGSMSISRTTCAEFIIDELINGNFIKNAVFIG